MPEMSFCELLLSCVHRNNWHSAESHLLNADGVFCLLEENNYLRNVCNFQSWRKQLLSCSVECSAFKLSPKRVVSSSLHARHESGGGISEYLANFQQSVLNAQNFFCGSRRHRSSATNFQKIPNGIVSWLEPVVGVLCTTRYEYKLTRRTRG